MNQPMNLRMNLRARLLSIFLFTLTLSGCPNAFDPLDSPTSDAQILSAARAAFDKGELTLARDLYLKLGNNDAAEAELAFVNMNEAGVTMTTLVSALRISSGEAVGSILTKLAEGIAKSSGDVATRRTKLADAFNRVSGIENQQVRGFVRFLVAISISANILSENTGVAGDLALNKADIVASSSSCDASTTSASCAVTAGCGPRAGSGIAVGSTSQFVKFESTTDTSVDLTTPTYLLVADAILGATKGLNEMQASTGDAQTLTNQMRVSVGAFTLGPIAATGQCFLSALINTVGVGQ